MSEWIWLEMERKLATERELELDFFLGIGVIVTSFMSLDTDPVVRE